MSDVLGIGKAVEKLADPVVDLLKRVAGPAADEIGLTLQDAIHVYRTRRAYRLAEKFQQFVLERGIVPRSVNLKLLLPIMDNASVEEDEDLHTMWAALLTNAADPAGSDVLPSFVEVLKQLTKPEAVFLTKFSKEEAGALSPNPGEFVITMDQAYDWWNEGGDAASFEVSMDDLHRLGLIRTRSHIEIPDPSAIPQNTLDINESGYYLTDYGVKFVFACRCPKKPPSTSAR